MIGHLRRNAVAYLALFVALGGTSYAAAKLERNSVGRAQLKDNAVSSKEVRNSSLLRRDFKAGQLPAGAIGPAGPAGSQGVAGPKGETGAKGDVGPTFAAQVAGGNTTPSATTDSGHGDTTLPLPAAGRVFAYGHANIQVSCSTGGAPKVGLYLDGVPVPGTGRILASGSPAEIDVAGISEPVAAGDRALELRSECLTGDPAGSSSSNLALGGVLVGG